jgi:hypothetical protein
MLANIQVTYVRRRAQGKSGERREQREGRGLKEAKSLRQVLLVFLMLTGPWFRSGEGTGYVYYQTADTSVSTIAYILYEVLVPVRDNGGGIQQVENNTIVLKSW